MGSLTSRRPGLRRTSCRYTGFSETNSRQCRFSETRFLIVTAYTQLPPDRSFDGAVTTSMINPSTRTQFATRKATSVVVNMTRYTNSSRGKYPRSMIRAISEASVAKPSHHIALMKTFHRVLYSGLSLRGDKRVALLESPMTNAIAAMRKPNKDAETLANVPYI